MAKITALAREQLGALAELNRINLGEHFYLAGGSGVAAHLRHRRSIDLDLFSRQPDADLSRLGAKVTERLEDTQVVSATDVALTIRAGKLAVDIVRYPYAVLEQPVPGPSGFPLASLLDLAAMKLSAVTKRGIRRDFWDPLGAMGIAGIDDGNDECHQRNAGVCWRNQSDRARSTQRFHQGAL